MEVKALKFLQSKVVPKLLEIPARDLANAYFPIVFKLVD